MRPGSTWRRRCVPPGCRSSAWSSTCRRPPSTSWPSTCRPSSSTPTCSTCIDLAGVPLHARTAARTTRWSSPGGHCAFNPEPLADFVDAFVLGDGEEVVGEINEVLAGVAGRRPAPSGRDALLRSLAQVEGVYVPALYRPPTRAAGWSSTAPGRPACRPRWPSARSPTWPSGPTRRSQLVPLTEVVHDRLNVEVFRGCTRGCRFCQAGMITRPVRERPAAAGRASMVRDGSRPDRLRRGDPHVALDGRLLGHRGHGARRSSTTRRTEGGSR